MPYIAFILIISKKKMTMKTLNELYGYNETEIEKIATNITLTEYPSEQVTKITKID